MANADIEFAAKKSSRRNEEKNFSTTAKTLLCGLVCGCLILCLLILLSLEPAADGDNKEVEAKPQPYWIGYEDGLTKTKISNQTTEQSYQICTTSDCQDAADFFRQNMDMRIDPCDDFYHFACGNFIERIRISRNESKADIFGLAQEEITTEMLLQVRKGIEKDELSAFKKLKMYYKNCMNESQIEMQGEEHFLARLKDYGGWPVLLGDKWKEGENGWIERVLETANFAYVFQFPARVQVGIDPKNTTKNLIEVLYARTIIRQTYFSKRPKGRIVDAYFDYMINIATMLGANEDTAIKEMRDCLEFEIALHNIKLFSVLTSDSDATYNPSTVGDLIRSQPAIPWRSIFDRIAKWANTTISEDEVVVLSHPTFLNKVERLIKRTAPRTIANYLGWLLVYDSIDYLPDVFLEHKLRFSEAQHGLEERGFRNSSCINEMFAIFPASLSALYVRQYFNKSDRDAALELVLRVKQQFRKTLEAVDWMDSKTKTAAQEKIDGMDLYVGYSDELFDDEKLDSFYKDLVIEEGSYLDSAMNSSKFVMLQHYKTLRKPVVKSDWTSNMNAAVINAYYSVEKNRFEIPASFLRRPFYRSNRPKYLNYGALGTIVGHEITHGFDNEGRKVDKDGNQVDWWQPSTESKYLQKAECIIDQYSNFTVEPLGLKLNGKQVESENIADNGGFKIAYFAYDQWLLDNGIDSFSQQSEPLLPGLNFTARQLFWIAAASNWCSKTRSEYLRDMVSRDLHSPPEARVTFSFANIEEFARDFHCPVGSRMNPEKKCVVW